jgi:Fur family peroxide stress response transcriptional regulator
MAVPADEVERRVQLLSQGIRDAGLRLTHQRREILGEIAAADTHPDVETVYMAVRARMPTISLDTVYRALSTLTDRGLVSRVSFTPGPARYDGNPARHHHFVCTRCGLMRDVEDASLDAIRPTDDVVAIGRTDTVQVQFRGVCAKCQKEVAGSVAGPAADQRSGA